MKLFDLFKAEIEKASTVKEAAATLVQQIHHHKQAAGSDVAKHAELDQALSEHHEDLADLIASKAQTPAAPPRAEKKLKDP